jgi:hypothetical protein
MARNEAISELCQSWTGIILNDKQPLAFRLERELFSMICMCSPARAGSFLAMTSCIPQRQVGFFVLNLVEMHEGFAVG